MATWTNIKSSNLIIDNRFDAEFFREEFVLLDKKILSVKKVDSLRKITKWIKKGIFDISPNRYKNEGVPIIRTFQIKSPLLFYEGLVFLKPDEHQLEYKKTELLPGDIVLTKIGAGIGDVALLPQTYSRYNFSQNVAGVSIDKEVVPPGYLLAYLLTPYGLNQIIRYSMPSGQGKIELRDIGKIKVIRLHEEEEEEVAERIQKAQQYNNESISLYSKALEILKTDLGIDSITTQNSPVHFTHLSDILFNKRLDAEFYHKKFEPFLKLAFSYRNGFSPLKNVTSRVTTSVQLRYPNEEFNYIEIGNIDISNGDYVAQRYKSVELPDNAKIMVTGGEIIVSLVRPTRGAIAFLDDYLPPRTVCSGAFYVCKAVDPQYREIIWLYIRAMKEVFEKYCGGTSYPTIESNYLADFPIPLFDPSFAKTISELILSAKEKKRESDTLLHKAKTSVERLIEEASRS